MDAVVFTRPAHTSLALGVTPIRLTRTYHPAPGRVDAGAVDYFTAHTDTWPPDPAEASFFSLDADARVHRVVHAAWDDQDRAAASSTWPEHVP
ncbi:hypothetical protein ACIOGZ_28675 [Kitasatospora sp. NPDC088160]|uniref:hypothetical protein n=1 Tax=Kitasatospora sp. NPDC088160 TaxID=3364072 RepID=UPI003809277D